MVLDAESSAIKYKVNRYVLDFGVQHFVHPVTSKMLSLTNEGGVPFNFELDLSDVKRKSSLQIDPMTAHILSNEKQKYKVTVLAGIPDKFVEHFKLQVLSKSFPIACLFSTPYNSRSWTMIRHQTQDTQSLCCSSLP